MQTLISKCYPISTSQKFEGTKESKGGHPEKSIPLNQFVEAVRSNESIRLQVEKIRKAVKAGNNKLKDKLKRSLPGVTPAGIFDQRRSYDTTESLTGLMIIDFDHIEDVALFKSKLSKIKHILVAFVSPSGDGVKVIIRTPAVKDKESYVGTFLSLKEFFNSDHLDDSGKDYTRLCFLSHDPDVYVNEDAIPWTQQITQKTGSSSIKPPRPDVDIEKREEVILTELRKIHPEIFTDISKNRNNECMKRSAMFCDYAISEAVTKNIIGKSILDWKDFDVREFDKAISQGYKNGTLGSKTITKRPDIPTVTAFSRGTKRPTTTTIEVSENEPEIDAASFSRGSKKNPKEPIEDKPKPRGLYTFVDEANDPIFWYYLTSGKGKEKKRTLKMDVVDLLDWLAYFGYASTKVSDEPKLVRIVDNVVEVVTPWDIKHFIINWLDERYELNNREEDEAEVKRVFLSKPALSEMKNLSGLPPVEIHKLKDAKDSSRIYFENCVAEVREDVVNRYQYKELDSLIWRDEINGRVLSEVKPKGKGHYEQFIENVSNLGEDTAELNKLAFETTIGYLVHTYKNPSATKLVVTNDSMISIEGASNGRSGKGLFGKSFGQIRSRYEISGKTLKPDDKFWLQGVKAHHQIVNIEDIARKFNWESLYNLVTDDWTVEQKYQGSIQIPASESPKIIASTNFTISNLDPSTIDRVHNLEFSTHYHAGVRGLEDHRPEDDFGCQLFYDWFGEHFIQWSYFDHYIIHCVQQYLKNGLVKSRTKNLKKRQLINAVGMHLVEWIEDEIESGQLITFDEKIANIAVHAQYVSWCRRNNIERFDQDQRSFTAKLLRYFRDNGYDVNTDIKCYHNDQRVRGFIVSKTNAAEQETSDEVMPPKSKVKFNN